MSGGRLQADVAAVLEGRLVSGQHRLLADHTSAAHRLQRPREGEDAPVPLPQLHRLRAEVLQTDTVAPLEVQSETGQLGQSPDGYSSATGGTQ